MKKLLLSLTAITLSTTAFADIQDPPMNEQGMSRKLGRSIANMAFGFAEIPQTIAQVNERDGNIAAMTYGFTKGLGRALVRTGSGFYEFITHPIPLNRQSFRPHLKLNVPWIHGGYDEFPPELGWQSRKKYVTNQYGY